MSPHRPEASLSISMSKEILLYVPSSAKGFSRTMNRLAARRWEPRLLRRIRAQPLGAGGVGRKAAAFSIIALRPLAMSTRAEPGEEKEGQGRAQVDGRKGRKREHSAS